MKWVAILSTVSLVLTLGCSGGSKEPSWTDDDIAVLSDMLRGRAYTDIEQHPALGAKKRSVSVMLAHPEPRKWIADAIPVDYHEYEHFEIGVNDLGIVTGVYRHGGGVRELNRIKEPYLENADEQSPGLPTEPAPRAYEDAEIEALARAYAGNEMPQDEILLNIRYEPTFDSRIPKDRWKLLYFDLAFDVKDEGSTMYHNGLEGIEFAYWGLNEHREKCGPQFVGIVWDGADRSHFVKGFMPSP